MSTKKRVASFSLSVVTATVLVGAQARPDVRATVDRSKPPRVADSAEGFTVRRLEGPIPVDGRTWIAIETVRAPGTTRAPNGQFTLTLSESTSVDVVHNRISFSEVGRAPVVLDPGLAVYAYITPDSRWIISGTLEVIDVRNWRKYSLSRAFKIEPWVVLRAMSDDGRRLFISRQPCPFDCQHLPNEYYEVTFPEREPALSRQGKRLVILKDGKELGSIDAPPRVTVEALDEGLEEILLHPDGLDFAAGFQGDTGSFVVVFLRQASGSHLAVDVSRVEQVNIGVIGPHRPYRDVRTVPTEWLPDRGDDAVQLWLQTRAWDMTGRRYVSREPLIITRDGNPLWR